jgi:uncharacterized SAM-binding protein YcdF (DUF218 family)
MDREQDLQTLLDFLAPRDEFDCAEALVLLGSGLPCAAEYASALYREKQFWHFVVSGGVGHSTQPLYQALERMEQYRQMETGGRTEAELFARIVRRTCAANLILEDASTNCGDNAVKTRAVLERRGVRPRTIALVQDPLLQRRSAASFAKVFPGAKIFCAPPFVPTPESYVLYGGRERFLRLALGEIPRLMDDENGYGPKGRDFIVHVEVPEEVCAAHARLKAAYPEYADR